MSWPQNPLQALKARALVFLPLFLLSLAVGLADAAAQDPPSPAPPRVYRIGPRDLLQVRVKELPDLAGDSEVGEDGTLTLPVVGTVAAEGLSEAELALRIREQLESEGLRRATVSVKILAFRSQPVSILGAVANPGNHYVPGSRSLFEVLMNAGGLTAERGASVYVRRRASNGLSDQVEIPLRALIEEGDPTVNIPIFAGDLINVPPVQTLTVHFLGEVGSVGSLSFQGNERATLLTAIARAGGLADGAARKIRIRRQGQGPDGEPQEIVADYRRILAGRDPDPELVDGDIIVVKESFF